MSVNLDLLYFDIASLDSTQFSVHFHCPVCGQDLSKRYWFDKTVAVSPLPNVNFNAQVAFLIPNHNDLATGLPCAGSGQQIRLYVALHRDATYPLAFNISPNPIPALWRTLLRPP